MIDTEISVVIVKLKFNFKTPITQYQIKLKEIFNKEYSLDAIENCLLQMEEDSLNFKQTNDVQEIPDDYSLNL